MGKRKNKLRNLVKVDLEEYELPVLVQQSSRDGRRVEKTIHKVPVPRANPPRPRANPPPPRANPPPLTFDPSPMFEDTQDASPDAQDPGGEPTGAERVRPRFLSPKCFLTRMPVVVGSSAYLVP